MMGFKEDLLNGVIRDIEQNWEAKNGNLSYFIAMVKDTPLTVKDLDNFLTEHGDTCHEGVNNVFASIVYGDYIKQQKGGEL